MADAPRTGLYSSVGAGARDGGRFELTAGPFGPAGLSAVELADGSVWEVDHAEPGRLVGLDLDGADPAGSPLLIAAVGADQAARLVDEVASGPATAVAPSDPSRSRPPIRSSVEARRAGRLVVLADLAGDARVDPFQRVVCAIELAASVEDTPGGDLLVPLIPDVLRRSDRLAEDIGDGDVAGVGPEVLHRFLGLFDQIPELAARHRIASPGLAQLGELLRSLANRSSDEDGAARGRSGVPAPIVRSSMPPRAAAAAGAGPRVSAARSGERLRSAPSPDQFLELNRVEPSVLHVQVARSGEQRWVRVLRRDSSVLLAQAPMKRRRLLDRAELLVPPDVTDEEIEVQVVAADVVTTAPAPTELIRSAVRAGRWAASAERSGNRNRASARWVECASLWHAAGDPHRARLADERSVVARSAGPDPSLLVDGLENAAEHTL